MNNNRTSPYRQTSKPINHISSNRSNKSNSSTGKKATQKYNNISNLYNKNKNYVNVNRNRSRSRSRSQSKEKIKRQLSPPQDSRYF